MKKIWMGVILVIVTDFFVVYIFRLQIWATLWLIFMTLVCFPFFVKITGNRRRYREEYYEMSIFMEQFLCSYKRWGHIKMAFEDCATIFEKGSKIYLVIHRVIGVLKSGRGNTENTILENVFDEITELYDSRRIKIMSHFLCHTESAGGDVLYAVDILLEDLQMWKQRTLLYQKRKKYLEKEFVVSSLLAVFLCGFTHMILPSDCINKIENLPLYQLSTIAVLSGIMLLALFLYHHYSKSWLDVMKEMDSSIEEEFPYWLLSVSLHLQNNSVYHAIEQSLQGLRGWFRREVERLLRNIYEAPNSLEPYVNFFKGQSIMELQTGMKILYSVNNNEYSDTRRQVRFLVQQTQYVMDQNERNRNQTKLAMFQMFKQFPMVMAGAKIVFDAIVFVLVIAKGTIIG